MSTLREVGSEDEFYATIAEANPSTLLALSFHTPWAAPCTQMRTILEALASTYPVRDPPTVSFLSINAEELPDMSESYDITAVPYLLLVKDGQTVESVSGCEAGKVRDAVERHAGKTGNSGKFGIPPALQATPRQEEDTNAVQNGVSTSPIQPSLGGQQRQPQSPAAAPAKDLSSYAPSSNDPPTAPAMSSTAASKEELHTRLANLVKAAPVMLFMKGTPGGPQCGFSRQIVSILRQQSVKYGFFNILADDDVRQGLKEFADWPTFPQLWIGGELVGGLDIVRVGMFLLLQFYLSPPHLILLLLHSSFLPLFP